MKKYILSITCIFYILNISGQIKDDSDMDTISYPVLKLESREFINKPASNKAKMKALNNDLHPHIPTTGSISESNSVGEIYYTSSVNTSGGYNISVPIEILEDTGGNLPQISLDYDSQQGVSTFGYGWSLTAGSRIHRVNRNMHFDNRSEGVKAMDVNNYRDDTGDAWALNGLRLIYLSTSGYTSNYITERGKIKVVAHMFSNDIKLIQKWTAYYPDGTVQTFITSEPAQRTYKVLDYFLETSTDINGNSFTCNYSYRVRNNQAEEPKLANIVYGRQKQGKITFVWGYRTDPTIRYVGGKYYNNNDILNEIQVTYNNQPYRTYKLTHDLQGAHTVLKQIDCISKTGQKFNPLKFYYGDNKQTKSYSVQSSQFFRWYNFNNSYDIRYTKGKFDYGNEDDGIITLPNKLSYKEVFTRSIGNLVRNMKCDYNGDEDIISQTGLSGDFAINNPSIKTGQGFVDIFCMEVDDHPGDEIVKVNNVKSGSYDRIIFDIYTSNLYTGLSKLYTREWDLNTLVNGGLLGTSKFVCPKSFYVGDFTGNGKLEVLVITSAKALGATYTTKVYIFDLQSYSKLYEGSPFNYELIVPRESSSGNIDGSTAYETSDKIFIVDFDGDGKNDICLINSSGTHFYSYGVNGGRTFSLVNTYTSLNRDNLKNSFLLTGDLNGDGKTDLLLSPDYPVRAENANAGRGRGSQTTGGKSNIWQLYISNGNGKLTKKTQVIDYCDSTNEYLLQDLNGDGIADLIQFYPSSTGYYGRSNTPNTTVYIFNTIHQMQEKQSLPLPGTVILPSGIKGKSYYNQLLAFNASGNVKMASSNYNTVKNTLLTGIISSLGSVEKIGYNQLNEDDTYSRGTYSWYPHVNYNGPMIVTSKIEKYFKGTKVDSESFSYTDGIIHKHGLGFRGFTKISNYKSSGEYTHTTYGPMYYNWVQKIETNSYIQEYGWENRIATNKEVLVRKTRSTVTRKDTGIKIETLYTYADNTYDNVKKEEITFGEQQDNLKTITEVTYNNVNTTNKYFIGIPQTVTVTDKRGTDTFVTKSEISYNTNYLPLSKRIYKNGFLTKTEEYTYNTTKDVVQTRNKSFDQSETLVTNFTYDAFGRINSKTDAFNIKEEYIYGSDGLIVQMKNHKGQFTSYEYDCWGRKIKEILPTGKQIITAYNWYNKENGVFMKTQDKTGSPAERIIYDYHQREIIKGARLANGLFMYEQTEYNSRSQIGRKSLKYTENQSPSRWTVYSYDDYNRITSIVEPSGKRETSSYEGNKTKITTENIQRTLTFDARGQVVRMDDPAGTTTYKLRADAQPISVTSPGNNTITFEYDGYGRQTATTEPSSGRRIYNYSINAGEKCISEILSNGKTINTKYDKYDRITYQQNVGSSSVDYLYNNENQLTSVIYDGRNALFYEYDNFGRIKNEKEIFEGRFLQKIYSYTENGELSSTIYSSHLGSLGTEEYNYMYGSMTKVKFNGQEIWSLKEMDANGNPTKIETGQLTRTYAYDPLSGMPTARTVAKTGTSNYIQNFSYSFNPYTGNLDNRKSNNLQENFTYDNLNRLVAFSGMGFNRTIAYSNNGNITNYSSVGNYTYEASKPFTLASITTTSGSDLLQRAQYVEYNAYSRPSKIMENNYTANLFYRPDGERVKMQVKQGNTEILSRHYFGMQYEIDVTPAGTKEKLYLINDVYNSPVVLVKQNSTSSLYYICRDYLNSITHITDANGNLITDGELSYDAWGRFRNPTTYALYSPDDQPAAMALLGRGYTGHEHLPWFGLINANARLYDPVTARFLSPDPVLQYPLESQNYNRYAYCMNNPLRYNDKSGEIFGFIFTFFVETIKFVVKTAVRFIETVFLDGGLDFTSTSSMKEAWSNFGNKLAKYTKEWAPWRPGTKTNNALRIEAVWLLSIPVWEFGSSYLGYLIANIRNIAGDVDNVDIDWRRFAILVNKNNGEKSWGFTLGPIINSQNIIIGDPIYFHELGHTIQSRFLGPFYVTKVAVPSLISFTFWRSEHDNCWYEVWATNLGGAQGKNHKYRTGNVFYWFGIFSFPFWPF